MADEPRKILLVEDNADARAALRLLLEISGHEVIEAEDGRSALDAAKTPGLEIALVDIGLPGIDGYEVARRIRTIHPGRGLRLIALTGYDGAEDRRLAEEAGFDAHLVKPADPDRLLMLIDSLG